MINNPEAFAESELHKKVFLAFVNDFELEGIPYEFSPKEQHERGDAGIVLPQLDVELKASKDHRDSVSINVRQIELFRAPNKIYVCSFSPSPGKFDMQNTVVIPSILVGEHMDRTTNKRETTKFGSGPSRAFVYREHPAAILLPDYLEWLEYETARKADQEAVPGTQGAPGLRGLQGSQASEQEA